MQSSRDGCVWSFPQKFLMLVFGSFAIQLLILGKSKRGTLQESNPQATLLCLHTSTIYTTVRITKLRHKHFLNRKTWQNGTCAEDTVIEESQHFFSGKRNRICSALGFFHLGVAFLYEAILMKLSYTANLFMFSDFFKQVWLIGTVFLYRLTSRHLCSFFPRSSSSCRIFSVRLRTLAFFSFRTRAKREYSSFSSLSFPWTYLSILRGGEGRSSG